MKYIGYRNTLRNTARRELTLVRPGSVMARQMRLGMAILALIVVVGSAAACAGAASPAGPSVSSAASAVAGAGFSYRLLPGNSVTAALPTDAPLAVRSMAPLRSCGAQILFAEDVDISPVPTSPWVVTTSAANQVAIACLIDAWENGQTAQLTTAEISDEADEIFTIYRLPGDGTVQVVTRVLSHTDKVVAWTTASCRQLSDQAGQLTPADCNTEVPIH
jgi:hypothetical protein